MSNSDKTSSSTGFLKARFTGQNVIITGGAGGIGRAAALGFAREGARVAILDIDKDCGEALVHMIEAQAGKAAFFQSDVSDSESLDESLQRAIAYLGSVDVLFNHVGKVIVRSFLDSSDKDFDAIMNTNVRSAFRCCQRIVREMLKTGGGSIIISSSIGASLAFALESLYCMSKAATLMLARCIAIEHREDGIRANALCPAFVRTGHGLKEIEDYAKLGHDWDKAELAAKQGRICEPDEVARAALFLASDEASFINGCGLDIDNGWSVFG